MLIHVLQYALNVRLLVLLVLLPNKVSYFLPQNKVSPSKSKYDRAFASSDELNAGNWYLPHPQIATWVESFLFELSSFPRG